MSNLPNQKINAAPRLIWTVGGITYEFEHHPIGTVFNTVGGVYMFCAMRLDGLWYAEYIGETDNFWRRLTNELTSHHRWDAIRASGATHICALVVAGDTAKRVGIETVLRHALNPSCNRQ